MCHPLYGTLPNDIPADGIDEECSGWSFRHEPSLDPARMQIFRIYEFVRIGTPEQSMAHRDEWLDRGLAALTELGLPVRPEAANDPFFGRVGRMLAANQLDSELKYEMCVDLTEVKPTAIGSSNYHEDHFGHSFDLHLADGTPAHSACVGFGLDRITLALFATHGMDPDAWPEGCGPRCDCRADRSTWGIRRLWKGRSTPRCGSVPSRGRSTAGSPGRPAAWLAAA